MGGEARQEFAGREAGAAFLGAQPISMMTASTTLTPAQRAQHDQVAAAEIPHARLRSRRGAADHAQDQREGRHQDRHTEDIEEGKAIAQGIDFGAQIVLDIAQLPPRLRHAAADALDLILLLLVERDGVAARRPAAIAPAPAAPG